MGQWYLRGGLIVLLCIVVVPVVPAIRGRRRLASWATELGRFWLTRSRAPCERNEDCQSRHCHLLGDGRAGFCRGSGWRAGATGDLGKSERFHEVSESAGGSSGLGDAPTPSAGTDTTTVVSNAGRKKPSQLASIFAGMSGAAKDSWPQSVHAGGAGGEMLFREVSAPSTPADSTDRSAAVRRGDKATPGAGRLADDAGGRPTSAEELVRLAEDSLNDLKQHVRPEATAQRTSGPSPAGRQPPTPPGPGRTITELRDDEKATALRLNSLEETVRHHHAEEDLRFRLASLAEQETRDEQHERELTAQVGRLEGAMKVVVGKATASDNELQSIGARTTRLELGLKHVVKEQLTQEGDPERGRHLPQRFAAGGHHAEEDLRIRQASLTKQETPDEQHERELAAQVGRLEGAMKVVVGKATASDDELQSIGARTTRLELGLKHVVKEQLTQEGDPERGRHLPQRFVAGGDDGRVASPSGARAGGNRGNGRIGRRTEEAEDDDSGRKAPRAATAAAVAGGLPSGWTNDQKRRPRRGQKDVSSCSECCLVGLWTKWQGCGGPGQDIDMRIRSVSAPSDPSAGERTADDNVEACKHAHPDLETRSCESSTDNRSGRSSGTKDAAGGQVPAVAGSDPDDASGRSRTWPAKGPSSRTLGGTPAGAAAAAAASDTHPSGMGPPEPDMVPTQGAD